MPARRSSAVRNPQQLADESGFALAIEVAEHHNMPGIASSRERQWSLAISLLLRSAFGGGVRRDHAAQSCAARCRRAVWNAGIALP